MAGLFEKGFNKFADFGNALNKGANKMIGKEVFGEIRKFEAPKEFPPYESYPAYTLPEPVSWVPLTGKAREFSLCGNRIRVSASLDTCVQYIPLFKSAAKYYSDRFQFKYSQCVKDYDSLLHYFQDIYFEGLYPMVDRAYGLLLPFGIFNVSAEKFRAYQVKFNDKAIQSYGTILAIGEARNQAAQDLGDAVGNSMQMEGGGFGIRGAMKGAAKAEAFNIGMSFLGKYIANQTKMTEEEKADVFSKFRADLFFKEVYSDYLNTFLTTVRVLSENGVLTGISVDIDDEYTTMVNNLKNPLFPPDKVALLLAQLISKYPFSVDCYKVLKDRYGEEDEAREILSYFYSFQS